MKVKVKSNVTRWLVCHRVLIVVATTVVLISGCQQGWRSKHQYYSRNFTAEEWMGMVEQCQNQATCVWEGLSKGYIKEKSAGCGMTGLQFTDSPAHFIEHHWDKMQHNDPLFFLPLFDSQNPQVILTGMHLYIDNPPRNLSDVQAAKIAAAFRKLLDNKDSRIRSTAISTLGSNRWLAVEDVEKGLNDRMPDVAWPTALLADTLFENGPVYNSDGKLIEDDPDRIERLIETKRKLAPILLEHLNHTHFNIRKLCALKFGVMLRRRVQMDNGTTELRNPGLQWKFDWVRSDWHSREQTKLQWKKWWSEHAEEALRFAHPPQDKFVRG